MSKQSVAREMLDELRRGADRVQMVMGGIDTPAILLTPHSQRSEEWAFLLIDAEKKNAPGPVHFHLDDKRAKFYTFTSTLEAKASPLPAIFSRKTKLVVVMGVLSGLPLRKKWWALGAKLLGRPVQPEQEQLMRVRRTLFTVEAVARDVRSRLEDRGTVVVQAVYDTGTSQAYWDLDQVIENSESDRAGLRLVRLP